LRRDPPRPIAVPTLTASSQIDQVLLALKSDSGTVKEGGPMATRWFTVWGWIHRPVSWQGLALVLLCAVFCVQVFIAVDRHSHSASDMLYGVFPYVVPALVVLEWVASKTSEPGGRGRRGSAT